MSYGIAASCYVGATMMRGWVPIPGSAQHRLLESSLQLFEQHGYELASVTEIAANAGVTTGALYHHFGSKLGLYALLREDLEKRIDERMQGALAVGGRSRRSAIGALRTGLDAAVHFSCCRIVGEPHPAGADDRFAATIATVLPESRRAASSVMVAAWRAALLAIADGRSADVTRRALAYALGER